MCFGGVSTVPIRSMLVNFGSNSKPRCSTQKTISECNGGVGTVGEYDFGCVIVGKGKQFARFHFAILNVLLHDKC